MAVEVGSAVGYLDLDISGFLSGLRQANDEAGKQGQQIEKTLSDKFKSAGQKISSAGSTLTKTVTLPILGVGTAGMKVATDFEKAMSEVRAITGATGDNVSGDFSRLRNEAIELGASTAFSAGEVANAMTEMAKAGWNTEQIIAGMGGVLDAAAASGESLGSVSTIVADAITGFGMAAADSSRVADLLTQAANAGTIGVGDLGESFKYIAPVAQSMGLSIEDVTTAISAMSMAGIKGSQAGTSLRGVLTRMVKPTDAVAVAMEELGIVLTNQDGSFKSLDTIVAEMRTSFSGLSDEQKTYYAAVLAGQEGMSGLLSLLNLTQEEYDAIAASMDNAGGVAQKTAEVMQDNLQSKIEQLMGSLESLAIVLADNIIPSLTTFIEWLTGLIEKFTALDPAAQKTILVIAGIALAIGPVLSIIGKLTTGVGGVISIFEKFGGAAAKAAPPISSSTTALGGMAKTALSMVGAGAGIMLAATGLALLAQSSIALADAGWPAIAVMGGLVVALAGLAVGAAAIAPALTAGAVGLVAFGGAVALVGVGILAATGGVALLATQLPVISQYGAEAATNIALLGGAMVTFGGGALAAGGGAATLGAGLLAVGAGATAAAAGVALLGVGVIVLGTGVLVLGAGLATCGAGLTLISNTANSAADGLTNLTVASGAAFIPIAAGALSCTALAVAFGALAASVGLAGVAFLGAATSCALLLAAMAGTASSVKSIEKSASSAADSLEDMVKSVDVAKAGIEGLGSLADRTMTAFVKVFSNTNKKASSEATSMANNIVKSIDKEFKHIPKDTESTMKKMNNFTNDGMKKMNSTVKSSVNDSSKAMSNGMNSMNSAVSSGMSKVNSTIRSGFSSATSYIKSLSGQARSWGADIIQGIANGINSKIGTLKSAVNNAANVIYKNLHFSVPDEGPLTEYETWMPDFMKGLAKGIQDNSYRVKSAMQGVAEDMVLDVKPADVEAFSKDDTKNLKDYNITLIDTVGLYKQLIEQMKLYSEYSGIVSGDNNIFKSVTAKFEADKPRKEEKSESQDEKSKPDVLNIPITIGEEQIETVVVDLLRREVRT